MGDILTDYLTGRTNYLAEPVGILSQKNALGILSPSINALNPVTANRNMLAQSENARAVNPRNQLSAYEMSQMAGMVPGLGLLGVLGDIGQYVEKPETRGLLGYGLTALGAVPFLGAMAKMAGPLPKGVLHSQAGAIAYHGSPHTFDKFDMSKVGTGEGAQAYGHGLYFAENPAVASDYANRLSQGNAALGNASLDGLSSEAKKIIEYNLANNDMNRVQRFAQQGYPAYQEAWEFLSKNARPQSNLYKVDLPDEQVGKMLDWDKPLSQQPASVRDAVNRVARDPRFAIDRLSDDMRGVDIKALLNNPLAVQELNRLGVPGISYLDQGSRASGQGTRNFVVFDDSLPKIIERK